MTDGESTARWPLFPDLGSGLSYALHRTRRRTISIEVHPHGQLVVRCPIRLPIADVEAFLRSRRSWIAERLLEARRARSVIPPLPSPLHFHHRGTVMEWSGTAEERARWQRNEAREVFHTMIHAMLPTLGVAALRYRSLALRKMRRRWGSCSSDGRVTLNEYLVRLPDVCSEAVVAHELAHLVHMDHSRAFQQLAREIMPGYDEANAHLDAWTALLAEIVPQKNNGAHGPVEHRIVWLTNDQAADVPAHNSSNALVRADAIISGDRPSM